MEAHSTWPGGRNTEPLPQDLEPGSVVGDYEIMRKLPRAGGWGQVYEARPKERDSGRRQVAVKTIKPEYGADSEYRRRFRNEQQGFRGIKHPNLCCPFDWNKNTSGQLWLAMPWVDGEDLYDVVHKNGRLQPARAAALIAQAADGLQALHTQGEKAHCDVHPGNLMVEAGDRLVVIDFGLAKRFNHPSGSPPEARRSRWVPPEGPSGGEITESFDIYSLGLVLAFAVSGQEPEDGRARFDPGPDIPAELRAIIDTATAPHPEARQRSAAKLAADLRKFLASEIPLVPAASPASASESTPVRSRRALPVGVALVAAAAAAAAAYFGTSSLASSSTKDPSRVRAESSGLTLTAPVAWRTASVADADRKLGMQAAVGGADAIALVGSIDHAQVATAVEGRNAVDVSLPAGDALRVDDAGAFDARRMYIFHTPRGYPAIVCRGSYGVSRHAVDAACGRLATTASLADPALPIPYPTAADRRQAATALHSYAKARRAAATAIEGAATHAAVEAAAREIASKASSFAKGITAPDLGALRRSLAGAAKAWQVAAKAAAKGAGFHPAGKEVEKAEDAIRSARRRLVELGYAEPEKSAGHAA